MLFSIPKWCIQCKCFIHQGLSSPNGFLCSDCYKRLPRFSDNLCLKCGGYHDPVNCNEEWSKNISGLSAVFPYENPLQNWISSFKYSRNIRLGRMLRALVTDWFDSNLEKLGAVDWVVPVPIHNSALRIRGFNQTSFLIAKQKHLKEHGSLLVKNRKTEQLAGKNKTERKGVLKDVFSLKHDVKGKTILLFDDVCTTGQTLAEISQLLIKAGAERIDCLVLCRSLNFS